jgi:hypothetical protein
MKEGITRDPESPPGPSRKAVRRQVRGGPTGAKEPARPEREPWPEPTRGGPKATERTPLPEPRRLAKWSGPAAGNGQAIGPEEGPHQTREIRRGCRRSARSERANPSEPGGRGDVSRTGQMARAYSGSKGLANGPGPNRHTPPERLS